MERQIPLIRHRRAEDVRREILNHLPPVTRRFAMHHPVYIPAPDIFRHLQIEFRMSFLQRLSEQILEPQSQRVDMHQKLLVFDLDPVFVIFRKTVCAAAREVKTFGNQRTEPVDPCVCQ